MMTVRAAMRAVCMMFSVSTVYMSCPVSTVYMSCPVSNTHTSDIGRVSRLILPGRFAADSCKNLISTE